MKKLICVVDFEATCWEDRKIPGPNGQGWVEPRNEIIEFGAVMAEMPELEPFTQFQAFVRPTLNPVLTDFCKTLTSIRQEDVDQAEEFPHVLAAFRGWMHGAAGDDDVLFASWGDYDRKQLHHDCHLHRLVPGVAYPFDDDHLHIKQFVSIAKGWKPCGVGKAINRLGLKFEGTPHRGIDDAKNIFKVFKTVRPNYQWAD